jgi:nucleotide-binding universal stress UspA family protein
MTPRTIVVGVDGSGCTDAVVDRSVELARAFGDRLAIAHAAEPPHRSVGEEAGEHRRALEELGGGITGAAVARARAAGVEAEAVLVPARPVQGLLDLADQLDARYIVVGTASERPLTGLILGSVPHKLLHRSGVPVVVVPVPEDA